MELKRDLNSVQVCLMGSLKRYRFEIFKKNTETFSHYLEVDHMSLSLGGADVDVECVYLLRRGCKDNYEKS